MLVGILFKSAVRALVSTFFKERKEIQACLQPVQHLKFAFFFAHYDCWIVMAETETRN